MNWAFLFMKSNQTKVTRKYNYTVKTGRPALYTSAEEMEAKIKQYFIDGYYKAKIMGPFGTIIDVPSPGISDLALYLGFCDRHALSDYQLKPEFTATIKRARAQIERIYESRLLQSNCTGAIFALKNFGWKDKFDHEIDFGEKTLDKFEQMSTVDLQKRANELANRRAIASTN